MKFSKTFIKFYPVLFISFFIGFILFLDANLYENPSTEECTIGVVSPNFTSDGRPLLWKVRDNSELPNNEVVYDTTCDYNFIAVVNNGDTNVWMGVNEKGLAIVNSTAKDLEAANHGYSNGALMRATLGYCSTVKEFEELLIETNESGRKTRANFGLIDSAGAAVIFEVGGREYWKFDANNLNHAPNGYLIRTNFSITGGGNLGIQRYRRTESLIKDLSQENILNYEGIIKYHFRDFSDAQSNFVTAPFMHRWNFAKPFGYLYSNYSVSRYISISSSVFRGVNMLEPANHSTMWTSLGQPAGTIVLPYWPVGETPALARGENIAPLNQIADDIKSYLFDNVTDKLFIDTYKLKDDLGNGVWDLLLNLEDSIITSVGNKINNGLFAQNNPTELVSLESELADLAYSKLEEVKYELSSLIKLIVLNKEPYCSFEGIYFETGCVIQLIDAGDNGLNDLPINNEVRPNFGMPGGDDKMIGDFHYLGENCVVPNMFYFPVLLWNYVSDLPHSGDKIYLRIFNNDDLLSAEWYGDAQIYRIHDKNYQEYNPEILSMNNLRSEPSDLLAYANQREINYQLYANYPNPFNPTTTIHYSIKENNFVSLKVYDALGKEVATLVNEEKPAGYYEIEFDASSLSSGVYFYRFQSGGFTDTKKFILMK